MEKRFEREIRVSYVSQGSVHIETTGHDSLRETKVKDFIELASSVIALSGDKITLRLGGF
jgi:hypothetical protein